MERCVPSRRRRAGRPGLRTGPQSGFVLLIVLFVVVILTLSAYTFTELMLTHLDAAQHNVRMSQTRASVDSGVEAIKLFLLQDEATRAQAGGVFDNPYMFQAGVVVPEVDDIDRGTFTILAPLLDAQGLSAGVRYGLEDESTRLNLNFLLLADKTVENGGRMLLMGLPGMTEDVADAILDWIDEDEETREYGAETADYYMQLNPPYACKNAPLDTVEELLLVRGVTPTMLFGFDTNRNGMLDSHELQQSGAAATIGTDPTMMAMARGWAPYLTLHSAERNTNAAGQPRINLNQQDMQLLYEELSAVFDEDWVTFIVAYRLNGPYTQGGGGGGGGGRGGDGDGGGDDDDDGDGDGGGDGGGGQQQGGGGPATGSLDLTQAPKTQLSQVLDLVGKQVQVTFEGAQQPTILDSPFGTDILSMNTYMATLMDNCTTSASMALPGRININQAPRSILMGIPGMTEELADAIMQNRPAPVVGTTNTNSSQQNPNFEHETWLLTEGLLFNEQGEPDLARMRQLQPFICAGGDVYRAQVVGYFQSGGASSRIEVIVDGTGAVPRVVFWRDLSHLGRGYPIEVLGLNLSGLF